MTHQYELMVIFDPEIDERQVAPKLDGFLKVITNDGGTIEKVDVWGRRRLAYEIKKKNEGIYAVVDFTATSEATQELDQMQLLRSPTMGGLLRATIDLTLAAEPLLGDPVPDGVIVVVDDDDDADED